jgi:hypothetical protein
MTPLPIAGLDFPNMMGRHDYDLNVFPFVSGVGASSLKEMAFL